jgi:hypothetical protein
MHHYLYPIQDAYISNQTDLKDKNVGIDEMLSLGVSHSYASIFNATKTYPFYHEYVAGMQMENYTGIVTGSFFGISYNLIGTIVGGTNNITVSYFSGSVDGSITGFETGSAITSSMYSGSLFGFNGSIVAQAINGNISGSIIANCFATFTGQMTSSIGNFTGYLTGNEVKDEINYTTNVKQTIDRSLLKFDLSFISQSMVDNVISNPKFYLKLSVTEPRELPTTYKVYAFPISQSWDQGDGYWSDEGSDSGVSWNWRDSYSGSAWYSPHVETELTASVDYLNNYNLATESFKRGGGTWYNVVATQSFSYQTSDIYMDVTNIVNSWLTNTVPNEGFILMFSGETSTTSSNSHAYFFSRETNTIWEPRLDVAWDDSSIITGSLGTGSVIIESYSAGLTGSIISPITISNGSVSGSISGNAYLVLDPVYGITSGSVVSILGLSETVAGLSINGSVLGTSSLDASGSIQLIAALTSGDFSGCEIYGQYSSSMITGLITGSFNDQLFVGHSLSGSNIDPNTVTVVANENSPLVGNIMGIVISQSFHGGILQGVITAGVLKGANVSIPFTGSYSYLTSSYSFTSSVEITGSSFLPLNASKPFVVIIQDLKKEYSYGDTPRINVFGRERFPLKSFDKAPQQVVYVTPKYLPLSSSYSIKDNETEQIMVPFDNYSKLSCDLSGNYFYLDTTGLAEERYYRILIKVDDGGGNIYTLDARDLFKVRR